MLDGCGDERGVGDIVKGGRRSKHGGRARSGSGEENKGIFVVKFERGSGCECCCCDVVGVGNDCDDAGGLGKQAAHLCENRKQAAESHIGIRSDGRSKSVKVGHEEGPKSALWVACKVCAERGKEGLEGQADAEGQRAQDAELDLWQGCLWLVALGCGKRGLDMAAKVHKVKDWACWQTCYALKEQGHWVLRCGRGLHLELGLGVKEHCLPVGRVGSGGAFCGAGRVGSGAT